MKLQDFPLVMWAFTQIEADSAGSWARELIVEENIDPHWVVAFQAAENTLWRCGLDTVEEIPELRERGEYCSQGPDDRTKTYTLMREVIALPVDNDNEIVCRWLGIGEVQCWVTQHLLYSFFDGELRDKFREKRK